MESKKVELIEKESKLVVASGQAAGQGVRTMLLERYSLPVIRGISLGSWCIVQ